MGLLGRAKRKVLGFTDALTTPTLRGALKLATRDVTAEVAATSCLVLAPHPDDETLGCGATIARKTSAGAQVWVGFASLGTDSHRSRHLTPRQLGEIPAGRGAGGLPPAGRARRPGAVPVGGGSRRDGRRTDHPRDHGRARRRSPRGDLRGVGRRLPSRSRGAQRHRARDGERGNDWLSRLRVSDRFWADPQAARRWLAHIGKSGKRGLFTPVAVRTEEFLPRKREALEAHATQVTRFRDDETWSTLHDVDDGRWVKRFFQARELFFRRA